MTVQGFQGQAHSRAYLSRLSCLREQGTAENHLLQYRRGPAIGCIYDRPERLRGHDAEGQRVLDRGHRRVHCPTTKSRSTPTTMGRRRSPILPARRAIGFPPRSRPQSVPAARLGFPVLSGPMATGPTINGKDVDPNLDRGAAGGIDGFMTPPKEVHTLNDAILFAAKDLAQRPRGRRRIIYVISDGKESGSKATVKEVVRFLQGNNISVYATLVGDSATWGYGYLDRIKLPLLPANNVLPKYTVATGGSLDAEFHTDGMELSFSEYRQRSPQPVHDRIPHQVWKPGQQVPEHRGHDARAPRLRHHREGRATTRPRPIRELTRLFSTGFLLLANSVSTPKRYAVILHPGICLRSDGCVSFDRLDRVCRLLHFRDFRLGRGCLRLGGFRVPLIPSLKPRKPSPSPLPSSGSFLGPKISRAMTSTITR